MVPPAVVFDDDFELWPGEIDGEAEDLDVHLEVRELGGDDELAQCAFGVRAAAAAAVAVVEESAQQACAWAAVAGAGERVAELAFAEEVVVERVVESLFELVAREEGGDVDVGAGRAR